MPITLSTANDLVNGDTVARQQIGEFEEVAEPCILDSTPDVLSIGRRCVEDGYEFHWRPCSLHPTMTTAGGKVVTLISRDCCPYLDDFEPDLCNPAAAALPAEEKSVTWDPVGPMYDEPTPRRKKRVRPPRRHPHSTDADSDASSDNDYFGWPSAAIAAHVDGLSRKVGSSPLSAGGKPDWTMDGQPTPQPVRLSQQGIDNILYCLYDGVLPPASGRGTWGDDFCLGL